MNVTLTKPLAGRQAGDTIHVTDRIGSALIERGAATPTGDAEPTSTTAVSTAKPKPRTKRSAKGGGGSPSPLR